MLNDGPPAAEIARIFRVHRATVRRIGAQTNAATYAPALLGRVPPACSYCYCTSCLRGWFGGTHPGAKEFEPN
ncbi:hypothetical protein [Mesorhizobium sp. M0296]|uniref:hypothetical protein n=1 Tax=Mesorhizobium sp. M0296 TaxID=2956931 RepID=UPI003337CB71